MCSLLYSLIHQITKLEMKQEKIGQQINAFRITYFVRKTYRSMYRTVFCWHIPISSIFLRLGPEGHNSDCKCQICITTMVLWCCCCRPIPPKKWLFEWQNEIHRWIGILDSRTPVVCIPLLAQHVIIILFWRISLLPLLLQLNHWLWRPKHVFFQFFCRNRDRWQTFLMSSSDSDAFQKCMTFIEDTFLSWQRIRCEKFPINRNWVRTKFNVAFRILVIRIIRH